MRTFLVPLITAATFAVPGPAQDEPPAPRFPAADNADAWQLLPREQPPLPAWARTLARQLPKTTGGMLELDYLHRADNPLGAVMAGKLRWVAADAIGCDYARKYAEADLRRAGLNEEELAQLSGDTKGRPAMNFARKMTLAAHEVTDAEVAELIERFGPDTVVGMVHTLAHANFQNRIFLALGVEVEPGGPLPPVDYGLDAEKRAEVPTPPRPPWEQLTKATAPAGAVAPPDWDGRNFAELLKALDNQKEREPRLAPPEVEGRSGRIVWTGVSMGYQPELTRAWFDCMGTFQQESQLDRVFSNSVFWVITRSNECFY